MAAAVPPAAYKVTRYDCATQLAAITALAALADSQQAGDPKPFDSRVLPWIHGCDESHKSVRHIRHYVAQKANGTIVGWLLAETRRRFGRTYVYLSEISVIRIKSDEHKGIGRALHHELLVDADKDRANFVYLYPLTGDAKATYTGWGYRTALELNYRYPQVTHQFLVLREATDKRSTIPEKLLAKLNPPVPATLFVEAHRLAVILGDKDLAARVDRVSRKKKDTPDFVARVREALENIAIYSEPGDDEDAIMTREQQLESLHEIFDKEDSGGRRRTRRVRRVRSTRDLGARKTRRSPIKKRAYT
jgi:hypothetical protein